MVNEKDFKKFKVDYCLKIQVQEYQFSQWVTKFIFMGQELNKEYDVIYSGTFHIVFNELITSGINYTNDVLGALEGNTNSEKISFYSTIGVSLNKMKSIFTPEELDYIEYRRHNAAHIFQNKYEKH